ncbi:MAG: 50S ribosomal protein L18 [Candidatus Bathyarchaeia archaeon]
MVRGRSYISKPRRRRTGKTHYGRRKKLIQSRLPRLVLRISNKHTAVQFIEAKIVGDRVLASAHSRNLREFGWRGPCNNMPAVYLTSLLASLRARGEGIRKAILDIGLRSPTSGAKVFASLKAASEAGLDMSYDSKVLPTEERITGQHIAQYAKLLSGDSNLYKRQFGGYLKRNLEPEDLPKHFSEVREKIKKSVVR